MDENPYQSPVEVGKPTEVQPCGKATNIPFVWVFAAAALLSFCLSLLFGTSTLFILGGFMLLYLFGLMLIGAFSTSPQPYLDDLPPPSGPKQPPTPTTDAEPDPP